MEERNYIFSFNEQKCKVGSQKGVLKTFKIEEKLTDGSKVCVHTDIHFKSKEMSPAHLKVMKLLSKANNFKNRRAA